MRKSDDPALRDYDDYIASALRTEGGHLSIGRGGFILYYAGGARLSYRRILVTDGVRRQRLELAI